MNLSPRIILISTLMVSASGIQFACGGTTDSPKQALVEFRDAFVRQDAKALCARVSERAEDSNGRPAFRGSSCNQELAQFFAEGRQAVAKGRYSDFTGIAPNMKTARLVDVRVTGDSANASIDWTDGRCQPTRRYTVELVREGEKWKYLKRYPGDNEGAVIAPPKDINC